ncbi:MAG: NAD(P)H-binding protein [Actinobacteria bacterium]|nr:NAD(P)H-binding protein [Actinomycetota bacterium]
MTRRVAVLGASGGVGARVARLLAAQPRTDLRLGVRRPEAMPVPASADGRVEVVAVDARDDIALSRFCAGVDVVVACAGPSWSLLDRVARAAAAAGAASVDPAGDDAVRASLSRSLVSGCAVLSAGRLPGLSGLALRCAAGGRRPGVRRSVLVHAGGCDRFTWAGASDFLAALTGGHGEPNAMWRGGRAVSGALSPRREAVVPFFDGVVTALPFLGNETARVAGAEGLDEVAWYNVFGARVASYLSRVASLPRDALADDTVVEGLLEAAALDAFGRTPHHTFTFEVRDAGEKVRVLVLRGDGANELTAAVAAATTEAVLAGAVPDGVHFAAEVLDPEAVLTELVRRRMASVVDVSGDSAQSELVEEGAL